MSISDGADIPAWSIDVTTPPRTTEQELLGLAGAAAREGRMIDACSIYRRLLKEDPSSLGPMIGLGLVLTEGAQWAEAEEVWSELTRRHSDNFWGAHWLAYVRFRTGRRDEALAALEDAYSRGLEPGPLTERLTEVYCEAHRPREALDAFKRLLATGWREGATLDRLAFWIIRTTLEEAGFSPSVFSLDEVLISRARFDG